MASATGELHFKFCLILVNLNLNSYVSALLDSSGTEQSLARANRLILYVFMVVDGFFFHDWQFILCIYNKLYFLLVKLFDARKIS